MKDENVYLKNIKHGGSHHFPGKKIGDVFEDCGTVYLAMKKDQGTRLKPVPMDMVRRDPAWLRTLIEENRPYELPIFINTSVFNGVVASLINEDWSNPSLELLDYTAALMETAADRYIKSIDEIESLPQLRNFLLSESSNIVEDLKEKAREKVLALVERNQAPYTQNHYLFENISKLRSKRLKDELMAMLGSTEGDIDKSAVVSMLNNVFERNQSRSMDEHMAEEMQHALNAYGKVALKRFIDEIPMICIGVMQEFSKRVNEVLSGVMDDEIDQLVVAPPAKMRLMKDLERKIDALNNGIAAIKKLY